jgi:hypothetical protein
MLDISEAAVRFGQCSLTVLYGVLRQVLHIAAPLDVLPNLQVCAYRVDEICDDLIVDLQHAALAAEGQVLMALHVARTASADNTTA